MRNSWWLRLLVLSAISLHVSAASLGDGSKVARDFLTTWLIDQNVEGALKQLSRRRSICAPDMDSAEVKMRSRAEAVATLKVGMEIVNRKLGKRKRLVDAITPLPKERRSLIGALEMSSQEFTVIDGTSIDAKRALCDDIGSSKTPTIMALFLFKVPEDEMDGMYFVFEREGNKWAIIAFDRLKQ